ncbi:hypothetical protein EIN_186620 [Entamoeba invadens IP1]|uniref:hypothetical protein n=1 Tax=Entamoeba invadens IP1 TaxID=370355 RepID=UPI0002C3EF7C|nr:hypothetical protein EIN_186620 [Entamoeba invadens IP1]ELP94235.1 hypothetical protein EIN_186620 [Entamoeba invadens IP1]|eukprot:XP_004261006.1 hypothetical protein EIN_186620 [Entamoeba invadens IP1]
MSHTCCIAGCTNDAEFPLRKIQGTVNIKKELINTLPREWKICKPDFIRLLKTMECCIDLCDKTPTFYEMPESKLNLVSLKSECSHHQLCLFHANKYCEQFNQQPNSRPPVAAQPPVEKRLADDEDTVTESNQQNNSDTDTSTETREEVIPQPTTAPFTTIPSVAVHVPEPIKEEKPAEPKKVEPKKRGLIIEDGSDEVQLTKKKVEPTKEHAPQRHMDEEIRKNEKTEQKVEEQIKEEHHCCVDNCNSLVQHEIPILQPLHVYVCQGHLSDIVKLWRISLMSHQIVLNEECLQLVRVIDNQMNPFWKYENPGQNDVKCALCCGYYNKEETYNCSFCPFTFCVECYKHLCLTLGTPQQFISNKARWKCFVCSCCEQDKMERNNFIKQQLKTLLSVVDVRLKDGCVIGKSQEELKEFVDSLHQ